MISQEARNVVPLKWTFRFRFAKPTEKRVQEIDLNSTFSKNVSGWWSAWNVRLVIFAFFYVLILPKWHKLDTAFCKAYSKKCVKHCKYRHFLRFESCKNPDFFGHFGFFSRSTDFIFLEWFSEISPMIFVIFFTLFFLKVHEPFWECFWCWIGGRKGCSSLET